MAALPLFIKHLKTMSDSNAAIRQLEPTKLWNHFADLNAVPRPSKQETRVIEFARSFGQSLGLETSVDDAGNVLIHKSGTAGKEQATPVVLQSHLDMVHQKNADTDFDFLNQGIEMEIDGDWVKAKGTTLGADNGIGVAAIMAVLASDDISHPPLEALLTIDEETGMTGAKALQPNVLHGKILLNLDTEEDHELTIGCAGGIDVVAAGSYQPDPGDPDSIGYRLTIRGLTGGHSGMDIHKGRGNANQLMNRLLSLAIKHANARIASVEGGGLRNAIPRESVAVFAADADSSFDWLDQAKTEIAAEYQVTDPDLEIICESVDAPLQLIPATLQESLIPALFGITNGIARMSPSIPDLVQTSNNLARVNVADGELAIECLTRSSVDSERHALGEAIAAVVRTTGCDVELSGDYPGWDPKPDSGIVRLMRQLYQEMFDDQPEVSACHAGLECGLLGQHYPQMEMISFGPTIRGAHSPDEKVSISSVQKFWKYLLETLKQIQ
jgi:dipeptidase D